MRGFLAIISAASVAVVLQGCGDSGASTTETTSTSSAPETTSTSSAPASTSTASAQTSAPTSATPTSVTPTTTASAPATTSSTGASTLAPAPAPDPATPGDGNSIAQWMNELYTGYSPDDDNSPLGVTIQMHTDFVFYCGVPCYDGNADCRVSTSIYNHLVLVMEDTNAIALPSVNTAGSGMLFNQTAIETKLAKCSYQFDGATFNRLNGGCGCGAGPQDCADPSCAYDNIDPETGETATGTSDHVARCYCEDPRHFPATKTDQEQCYWKGPAFYPPDGPSQDETRKMLSQRMSNSQGTDIVNGQPRIKNEYWDEIVVDGNVLDTELARDAVSTIPAMVYALGNADAKENAVAMAAAMASQYNLPTPVPVIAIDLTKDVSTGGPFVFEDADATKLFV